MAHQHTMSMRHTKGLPSHVAKAVDAADIAMKKLTEILQQEYPVGTVISHTPSKYPKLYHVISHGWGGNSFDMLIIQSITNPTNTPRRLTVGYHQFTVVSKP